MNLAIIITAAGSGQRFGSELPKQFQPILTKPLLYYTILTASHVTPNCVCILPEHYQTSPYAFIINSLIQLFPNVNFIEGSSSRALSVRNGFRSLATHIDKVLIHDGVRPFATDNLYKQIFKLLTYSEVVIPVRPCTDTIKEVNGEEMVVKTINRNILRTVQTPQGFRSETLRSIYSQLNDDQISEFTDEASMAEFLKIPVKTTDGEATNLKITYPEDLSYAEFFLQKS